MKKFLLAATILLAVSCAGCFQGGSHLIITDGGEVFLRNKLIGTPLIAEQIEAFRKSFADNPNAEVAPVAENNMSGYEIRTHYPNVAELAASGMSLYSAHDGKCKGIRLKRGHFFDTYDFDLISAGQRKLSPSESAAVQSMLSQVTFDLVIELPYSADSHNADKSDVANKILTWNLAASLIGGTDKHIHAQFKLWNFDNIILTAAIELLLLAATIFFVVKARAEQSDSLRRDLKFKRNVFAGLFIALMIISAYMLFAPITFADAISAP